MLERSYIKRKKFNIHIFFRFQVPNPLTILHWDPSFRLELFPFKVFVFFNSNTVKLVLIYIMLPRAIQSNYVGLS